MASLYRHKWMGHAWACDGVALVRHDAPLPVEGGVQVPHDDWKAEIPKRWFRSARAWLQMAGEPIGETLTQRRYRPLLRAADRLDRVVVPSTHSRTPKLTSIIRAWRGDELIALVTEYIATDEVAVWARDLTDAGP